jgi:hypothetical protein
VPQGYFFSFTNQPWLGRAVVIYNCRTKKTDEMSKPHALLGYAQKLTEAPGLLDDACAGYVRRVTHEEIADAVS